MDIHVRDRNDAPSIPLLRLALLENNVVGAAASELGDDRLTVLQVSFADPAAESVGPDHRLSADVVDQDQLQTHAFSIVDEPCG